MIIVGINEGINSSLVVSKNEKIIFAIQEERLNKQKEYAGFPILSIKYAPSTSVASPWEVSYINTFAPIKGSSVSIWDIIPLIVVLDNRIDINNIESVILFI